MFIEYLLLLTNLSLDLHNTVYRHSLSASAVCKRCPECLILCVFRAWRLHAGVAKGANLSVIPNRLCQSLGGGRQVGPHEMGKNIHKVDTLIWFSITDQWCLEPLLAAVDIHPIALRTCQRVDKLTDW
jgi:hypothetical protein